MVDPDDADVLMPEMTGDVVFELTLMVVVTEQPFTVLVIVPTYCPGVVKTGEAVPFPEEGAGVQL